MTRKQFTLRRTLIAIAVVALLLRAGMWAAQLRRLSAEHAFAANAYEVESRNHAMSVEFYRKLAGQRKDTGIAMGSGYQDMPLYSNQWEGRLTAPRQEEWWPHASRPYTSDPDKDIQQLLALVERERKRAAYFALLSEKYRQAAKQPWRSITEDPQPPE